MKGLDGVSFGFGQAAVAWHFRFSLVIEPEASTAPDFFANLNCAGVLNPSSEKFIYSKSDLISSHYLKILSDVDCWCL